MLCGSFVDLEGYSGESLQTAVPALELRQEVFREDLEGEALTAKQLAERGQRQGGGVNKWEGPAAVRNWARQSCNGQVIEDPRHGPFPLLCSPDGSPKELVAGGHRIAVIRIKSGRSGCGRAQSGAGWLFSLVTPLVDPDLVASQQRINRLGGHVELNPATGKPEIGALYRDAATGGLCFDQTFSDAEVLNIDPDSFRARIIERSGGTWRPPTTDPDAIRAEIARRMG